MPILDPYARNRLLAIAGLERFVTNQSHKSKYVGKLRDWKKVLVLDVELSRPEMLPYALAELLEYYLKMFDVALASLMRSIWKDDIALINEFYVYIARYFVDVEARG